MLEKKRYKKIRFLQQQVRLAGKEIQELATRVIKVNKKRGEAQASLFLFFRFEEHRPG